MDIRIVSVSEAPIEDRTPAYRCSAPEGQARGLRIYARARVLSEIFDFLRADLNNERGGILIGTPCRDQGGRYVEVSDHISAESTEQSSVHMKFTIQSWARIEEEFERRYPNKEKAIVGWYHSHPNLRVFVSGNDEEVHKLFHSWYQSALVIDPAQPDLGFFANDPGSGRLLPIGGYFLFGDSEEELAGVRARLTRTREGAHTGSDPASSGGPPPAPGRKLAAFLVGTFLSGLLLGSWFERGRTEEALGRQRREAQETMAGLLRARGELLEKSRLLEELRARLGVEENRQALSQDQLDRIRMERSGIERAQKLLELARSAGAIREAAGRTGAGDSGAAIWIAGLVERRLGQEAEHLLTKPVLLSTIAKGILREAGLGRVPPGR